jgi:dolichol-phosphate mannosyltransferase
VQWLGFPVAEVPYTPSARAAGVSKYTLGKMLRLAGDGLFSFSRLPLRFSVSAGLVVTAVSLLASIGFAVRRPGAIDPLLIALLVAVHAVGGCLFAAIGVLGEYVARVHEQAKDRPIYLIRESWPPAEGEDEAVRPVRGRSRAA